MFSNKEINTLKGLLYAASQSSGNSPVEYRHNFDTSLQKYFSIYPNVDESDDVFSSGDFPIEE